MKAGGRGERNGEGEGEGDGAMTTARPSVKMKSEDGMMEVLTRKKMKEKMKAPMQEKERAQPQVECLSSVGE